MSDQPEPPIPARAFRAAQRAARDGEWNQCPPGSLDEVAAGVQLCRRCELWRAATQGVPGAGPAQAALMLVGEQPGDQEDLAGRPFVGPAGRVLDAGLERAGIDRAGAFVTNAVKHFKHEPRGKRRLHKTPDAGEVAACRWWLEAERRLVRLEGQGLPARGAFPQGDLFVRLASDASASEGPARARLRAFAAAWAA